MREELEFGYSVGQYICSDGNKLPDVRNIEEFYRTKSVADYVEVHWPKNSIESEIDDRARDGLIAGLEVMDDLDRDDPFWANTNLQPTIYKLPKFLKSMSGNQKHKFLWAKVGLAILENAHSVAVEPLVQIHKVEPLNLYLLVHTVFHCWRDTGGEEEFFLEEFLSRADVLAEIETLPAKAIVDGEYELSVWLEDFLAGL